MFGDEGPLEKGGWSNARSLLGFPLVARPSLFSLDARSPFFEVASFAARRARRGRRGRRSRAAAGRGRGEIEWRQRSRGLTLHLFSIHSLAEEQYRW